MGDKPPASGGLGRYHLGEPLGGGPTGEVFRAKVYGVAGYERQYALKRFHAALAADAQTAEILASSARSYASISHPHVARLHEYGVAQGQSFVAVELVNGLDAARLFSVHAGDSDGEPVPRGAILQLLVQVARGVGYAHARGIAHLGICPTNVLIAADGEAKITDIGLLRARLSVPPAEDPTLVARLPYLAPEQLDLAAGTAATDVFQLASLAYELLTGERAFRGRGGDEIAEALRASTPDAGDLAGPIWDALLPAFAREPSGRYANGSAFADALEAAAKRLALPGGRAEMAAAVKRAQTRAADVSAGNASGALYFPLPAPPATSPGVSLSSLAAGKSPSPRATLASLAVPPPTRPPPTPDETARGSSPLVPVAAPPPLPGATTLSSSGAVPPPPRPRLVTPLPAAPPSPPVEPEVRVPKMRTRAKRVSLPPRGPELEMLPAPPPLELPVRRRTRWPIVVVVLAILGAGGYLVYDQVFAEATPPEVAKTAAVPDAPHVAAAVTPDAQAQEIATAAPPATLPDAPAPAVAVATPAPAPEGKLIIVSTPEGADVYLDGAAKGKTPVELPASGDRHKLSLILAGHRLVRLDIEGRGKTEVALEPVEKFRGPAGIKVLCRSQRHLYVTVDGRDTGVLCPTERIAVERGEHTVTTYDPQSEETANQTVKVMETHNSARVTAP